MPAILLVIGSRYGLYRIQLCAAGWCMQRMLCLSEAQPRSYGCKHFGCTEVSAVDCLTSCQLLSYCTINKYSVYTAGMKTVKA